MIATEVAAMEVVDMEVGIRIDTNGLVSGEVVLRWLYGLVPGY